MGRYTKTAWVDRAVQFPRRFDKSLESSSSVTLTPNPGTVTQAGTPVNASALNNIETQTLRDSKVASAGRVYAYKNLAGGM